MHRNSVIVPAGTVIFKPGHNFFQKKNGKILDNPMLNVDNVIAG
jgi:hypothetical protein